MPTSSSVTGSKTATFSITNSESNSQDLPSAVVRFAGDSGDGMQLAGAQFALTSAVFGNGIATFPDYPAEIRAPVGTRAGVSAFQVHFASSSVGTPGDDLDALVALNAAAFAVHLPDLLPGGFLLVDEGGFDEKNLRLAEYSENPLSSLSLSNYRVLKTDILARVQEALQGLGLKNKEIAKCRNIWALGVVSWIYHRPLKPTLDWLEKKFQNKGVYAQANQEALHAGYAYAETLELFQGKAWRVPKAELPVGKYRQVSGNEACALGLVTASHLAQRKLFLGSYPITPASQILHELMKLRSPQLESFQAEDEIAAAAASVGAAFGGALAVTTTSGPGLCLKMEAINLAVKTELPLVVINVQRGGPSTGLPTKTEQSDLLQSVFGRNGDSPLPVLAVSSPADGFSATIKAAEIALRYMTPVILLSDGYVANGAEPWKIPAIESLPDLSIPKPSVKNFPNEKFMPYLRNPETGSRPWAIPGMVGFEHRIGGIEGEVNTGKISYDPKNHEIMTKERHNKLAKLQEWIGNVKPDIGESSGDILLLSWGGTQGAVAKAVRQLREEEWKVSHLHLRYLNPLPPNLLEILQGFQQVIIPEWNVGQLQFLIQGKLAYPVQSLQKVQGLPFKVSEIYQHCKLALEKMK